MEKKLEEAIETLATKTANSNSPLEAMQFAQAALNAANALAVIRNAKR